MAELLFWANCFAVAAVLAGGLMKRGGYIEYPFLAAATYAGWYLPQAYVLLDDTTLPKNGLTLVLGMSLLCFAMIVHGWRAGGRGSRPWVPVEIPVRRLIPPVAGLTAFAALMRLLIELQPLEDRLRGAWTGPLTIIAFFATLGVVSLAFSFLLVYRQRTFATRALLIANLALYAPMVLILFRRSEIMELALVTLGTLWFVRRISVPRTAIIAAAIVAVFIINGIGHLRALGGAYQLSASGELERRIPTIDEILDIDWLSVIDFKTSLSRSETRNAVYYMATVDRLNEFSYGAELWNRFIFAYVPGQIVGYEFKRSLMVGSSLKELVLKEEGYKTHTGTTSTGFAHSFSDFWFLGAIFFWPVAFWLRIKFNSAQQGNIFSQVIYLSTIVMLCIPLLTIVIITT